MKNKTLLILILATILTGCVKTDLPVTGKVLEHHERVFEKYALYYVELDESRVIEVSPEVFLIVDDGETCKFSGTSANNPHRYGRVKCEPPEWVRD